MSGLCIQEYMNYYTLTKEEKDILKKVKGEQLKGIKNITQAKTRYQTYARATLSKLRNINIRVSKTGLAKGKGAGSPKGDAVSDASCFFDSPV